MNKTLRILQVEDDPDDAMLVERALRPSEYALDFQRVETEAEMRAAFAEQWDIVIADYNLPLFSAPAALAVLKESGRDLPFIVVSGAIGEETAVALMRSGVHDYVMKENLARLMPVVERELRDAETRCRSTEAEAEKKIQEERLRASLIEKETLLREVHHRVKNNLQLVASLFNMQARRSDNPEVCAALGESRDRIQSMALIHERLYRSDSLGVVDFAAYMRMLIGELRSSYAESFEVAMELDVAKIPLAIDMAVPCGLIVNELVTNAIKYACAPGRHNTIRIRFAQTSGSYELEVGDDGPGIALEMENGRAGSLGLHLVQILAEQLQGELDICSSPQGTQVRLRFPAANKKEGPE